MVPVIYCQINVTAGTPIQENAWICQVVFILFFGSVWAKMVVWIKTPPTVSERFDASKRSVVITQSVMWTVDWRYVNTYWNDVRISWKVTMINQDHTFSIYIYFRKNINAIKNTWQCPSRNMPHSTHMTFPLLFLLFAPHWGNRVWTFEGGGAGRSGQGYVHFKLSE